MRKIYTKIKKEKKDTVLKYLERLHVTCAFPTTFDDKELNIKNCVVGKRRSLDDMYELTLSKFHNLSKKTFYKNIKELLSTNTNKDGDKNLTMLFCPDIGKWTIHRVPNQKKWGSKNNPLIYDYRNSLKKLDLVGDGTICANDILKS